MSRRSLARAAVCLVALGGLTVFLLAWPVIARWTYEPFQLIVQRDVQGSEQYTLVLTKPDWLPAPKGASAASSREELTTLWDEVESVGYVDPVTSETDFLDPQAVDTLDAVLNSPGPVVYYVSFR